MFCKQCNGLGFIVKKVTEARSEGRKCKHETAESTLLRQDLETESPTLRYHATNRKETSVPGGTPPAPHSDTQ